MLWKFGAKIKKVTSDYFSSINLHNATTCCGVWSQLTMTWLDSVQKRTHHEVDIYYMLCSPPLFLTKWKISSYSYCFSSQIFKIMVYSAKISSMWSPMPKIPGYIGDQKIPKAKGIYLRLFWEPKLHQYHLLNISQVSINQGY